MNRDLPLGILLGALLGVLHGAAQAVPVVPNFTSGTMTSHTETTTTLNETIHQIWHGEKMSDARKEHLKKDGFKNIEICRRCSIPRKMETNEKAIVDGREIKIKNYTNRIQEVGK